MPTWTLFFLFPGGHLILSGRENVRLFSLFQRVVNPESRGWESTPSSVFPPACPLILSGQSRPDLDAAERPTTSEVRTDLTGVLKTCFVFFFFFFSSALFSVVISADALGSIWTNQIHRESLRQRRRSHAPCGSAECVTRSEAPPPAAVQARIKIKIKKTNLSRQCGALRGSELPQT